MNQSNNGTVEPTHFESLYPSGARFSELEKLLSFVKAGNSAQVVSMPGVGRANLIGFLSFNRSIREAHLGEHQKWYHFVALNFSEIRKRPLLDATKFMFLSLVDSLRERKFQEEYEKAHAIFKESISFNDELVLFQGLKRTIDLLAIEKELTVVLLCDRFEMYIPMLTPEFFNNLRVLRNRAKYRFSVVFLLNRPLEDTVEPSLISDFYEFLTGHTISLSLQDEPSLAFRKAYIEKVTGKTLDETLYKNVLSLTSGHSKLTRLALEILLGNSHSGDPPTGGDSRIRSWTSQDDSLSNFLLSQKPIQGALYDIWSSLNPSEQQFLLKNHESGSMNHGRDREYLENIGLFRNNNITIPLFNTFLNQSLATKPKEEHLRIDANTNEIMKGPVSIADKLTASEFRLLRFFIENPGRIVEREEIIQTVWHEAKSTAGVTDQAIDQLIFRLRKKIEEDPNNPAHLQTIKGRGFRFTP